MPDDLLPEDDNSVPAQPKKTRVAPLRTHVLMTRNKEQFPAPHTADVHRDEVDNWAKGGWERAD